MTNAKENLRTLVTLITRNQPNFMGVLKPFFRGDDSVGQMSITFNSVVNTDVEVTTEVEVKKGRKLVKEAVTRTETKAAWGQAVFFNGLAEWLDKIMKANTRLAVVMHYREKTETNTKDGKTYENITRQVHRVEYDGYVYYTNNGNLVRTPLADFESGKYIGELVQEFNAPVRKAS